MSDSVATVATVHINFTDVTASVRIDDASAVRFAKSEGEVLAAVGRGELPAGADPIEVRLAALKHLQSRGLAVPVEQTKVLSWEAEHRDALRVAIEESRARRAEEDAERRRRAFEEERRKRESRRRDPVLYGISGHLPSAEAMAEAKARIEARRAAERAARARMSSEQARRILGTGRR